MKQDIMYPRFLALILFLSLSALPASAMVSPVFSAQISTVNTATRYFQFGGTGLLAVSQSQAEQPVAIPGTVANLNVNATGAPGAGKSFTFTLYKNGIAQTLTCVIADTNTSCSDTNAAHAVTFAAGDTASWEVVPSGTPTNSTVSVSSTMTGTNADEVNFSGGTSGLTNSAATWVHISGGGSVTTEASSSSIMPTSGTIDHLYLETSGTPGTGKSWTMAVVQNGSTSGITTTISNSGTTNSDLTHSISVAAGDTISLLATPSGTPSGNILKWGFRFRPTVDGETPIIHQQSNGSQFVTVFESVTGALGGFSTTEAARAYIVPVAFALRSLYTSIDIAPGVGKTRTVVSRINSSSNGTLTATISGAALSANDLTHSDNYSAGQTITWSRTLTGSSPALFTNGNTSAVIFIAPAVTTALLVPSKFRIFGGKFSIIGGKIVFQ
jgi:hypothetical protein